MIQNCADVSNISPDGRCRVNIDNHSWPIGITNQAFSSLSPVDIIAKSPWWTDEAAARNFANQVANSFGPLTTEFEENEWGPNFAYSSDSTTVNAQQYRGGIGAVPGSDSVDNPNCDGAAEENPPLCWRSFADKLNPAPSSVPGPLPLVGAAAAFGYSRRLRSRIKSSAD